MSIKYSKCSVFIFQTLSPDIHCLHVNAGPEAVRLDLPWSAPLAVDALTEQRFLAADGVVRLTLPPWDAVLLI